MRAAMRLGARLHGQMIAHCWRMTVAAPPLTPPPALSRQPRGRSCRCSIAVAAPREVAVGVKELLLTGARVTAAAHTLWQQVRYHAQPEHQLSLHTWRGACQLACRHANASLRKWRFVFSSVLKCSGYTRVQIEHPRVLST